MLPSSGSFVHVVFINGMYNFLLSPSVAVLD